MLGVVSLHAVDKALVEFHFISLSIRVFFFFFSNETVLMASFCFQSLETFLWIYFFNFFFLFSNKKHILILYRLAMRYGRVGAALKTSFPAGLNEPERLCLCACGEPVHGRACVRSELSPSSGTEILLPSLFL